MIKIFKVVVKNISVRKPGRGQLLGYYNFDYRLYVDGKLKTSGTYDASYTISPAAMRRLLNKDHAHRLVILNYV